MSQPDQKVNWKDLCQMWKYSKPQYLSQWQGMRVQSPKAFSKSDVPILREWVLAEDNNLSLT